MCAPEGHRWFGCVQWQTGLVTQVPVPFQGTREPSGQFRGPRSQSLAWPPATDLGRSAAGNGNRLTVGYTLRMFAQSPSDRDAADLRAFLADRDVECPRCRYNLRGLTTSICPECRTWISLGLQAREPALGLLLFAAAGVLVLAIPSLLALIRLCFRILGKGSARGIDDANVFIAVLMAAVGYTIPRLMLGNAGRAWFGRRSVTGRVALTILCWSGSVAIVYLLDN